VYAVPDVDILVTRCFEVEMVEMVEMTLRFTGTTLDPHHRHSVEEVESE